jgi:hypothetical protein
MTALISIKRLMVYFQDLNNVKTVPKAMSRESVGSLRLGATTTHHPAAFAWRNLVVCWPLPTTSVENFANRRHCGNSATNLVGRPACATHQVAR